MCVCFTRKFKIKELGPPPDVKEEFKKYAEGGNHMTGEQLLRFLVEVQGETGASISDAERVVEQVLQKRHHISKYTRKHTLSLDDFHHYLFSVELNPPIGDEVLFLSAFVTWGVSIGCLGRRCRGGTRKWILTFSLFAPNEISVIKWVGRDFYFGKKI